MRENLIHNPNFPLGCRSGSRGLRKAALALSMRSPRPVPFAETLLPAEFPVVVRLRDIALSRRSTTSPPSSSLSAGVAPSPFAGAARRSDDALALPASVALRRCRRAWNERLAGAFEKSGRR